MKRLLVILFGLSFVLGTSSVAYAQQTSTFDFYGGVMYGESIDFDGEFPEDSTPNVSEEEFDATDPELLSNLNGGAPYAGIGAVGYEFDWNLPDWDIEHDWYLNAYAWIEGEIDGDEFSEEFDTEGDVYLGYFSLSGLIGASQADVLSFLSGIPMTAGDEDIGGYLIDGDWNSGAVYFALVDSIPALLEDNNVVLPWDIEWPDALSAEFGANIELTAVRDNVVPEPTSLSLLGLGLIGLYRKRKKGKV